MYIVGIKTTINVFNDWAKKGHIKEKKINSLIQRIKIILAKHSIPIHTEKLRLQVLQSSRVLKFYKHNFITQKIFWNEWICGKQIKIPTAPLTNTRTLLLRVHVDILKHVMAPQRDSVSIMYIPRKSISVLQTNSRENIELTSSCETWLRRTLTARRFHWLQLVTGQTDRWFHWLKSVTGQTDGQCYWLKSVTWLKIKEDSTCFE